MTTRPRVAVVKPDFGAVGGFERHLDVLERGLIERGWDLTRIEIDGRTRPRRVGGLPILPVNLEHHDEYFMYLGLVERVRALRLDRFDLVLSTQPPTYLVDHRRVVALCYHQARQFYDLADLFAASGFVDPELHARAVDHVRSIDTPLVQSVRYWLAGSADMAGRLRDYWSIPTDRIAIHHAPPTTTPSTVPTGAAPGGPLVCVGRQEWPKRTELVVQAINLVEPPTTAALIGGGSRLDLVRSLDRSCAADPAANRWPAPRTWMNRGIFTPGWRPAGGEPSGRVTFATEVDDRTRDRWYDDALAVVAPAYREDYGLTALEAMARAKPVIVCRDGGGLTETVVDGVTGLVVDPEPEALAEAIERLVAEPETARQMGLAGRARVAPVTPAAAIDQVEATFRRVLAG
ncbi:MAG: glycosyltransferase family 4 protein [Acidimicrobiales bacterium]